MDINQQTQKKEWGHPWQSDQAKAELTLILVQAKIKYNQIGYWDDLGKVNDPERVRYAANRIRLSQEDASIGDELSSWVTKWVK